MFSINCILLGSFKDIISEKTLQEKWTIKKVLQR